MITKKITTTFRCHSDVNINTLVAGVREMTGEYFAMCDRMTLDGRTEWFLDNLWRLYNRHCHKETKILSRKRLVKLCVTTDLRRMANLKHYLFKRYKTNQVHFRIYNEYKNNLCARFKRAKIEY